MFLLFYCFINADEQCRLKKVIIKAKKYCYAPFGICAGIPLAGSGALNISGDYPQCDGSEAKLSYCLKQLHSNTTCHHVLVKCMKQNGQKTGDTNTTSIRGHTIAIIVTILLMALLLAVVAGICFGLWWRKRVLSVVLSEQNGSQTHQQHHSTVEEWLVCILYKLN